MQQKNYDFIYKIFLLFKPHIDKWVVKALIGTGLTLILSGLSGIAWYVAIALNIIKKEVEKHLVTDFGIVVIEWKSVIIGGVLVLIGLIIYVINKRVTSKLREKPKLLISILHKSIDDFLTPEYSSIRNGYYKDYEVQEIEIDQSKTYKNGSLSYQEFAVLAQVDLQTKIKTLHATNPNSEIAYFGLAHIPLLFYIGVQIADKYKIEFFEYNRTKYSWDYLDNKKVEIDIIHTKQYQNPEDINGVIKMEVSYNINDELIREVLPSYSTKHNISLKKVRIDAISYHDEIVQLSKVFRETIDEIMEEKQNVETIHLFYAGSVSLAVNLARKISKRTDPEFVIYNYERNQKPKYKWAININQPIQSEDIIIKN